MRLDKFLGACQVGTRSEVKKIMKQGLITVNGEKATRPEMQIQENTDVIAYKGQILVYEKYVYYLLYKTKGCVTATTDKLHATVMDLLPEDLRKILTPVGRLDLDTEGLLLLTNDGDFTHHILSPSHHVPKTYWAKLDAKVPMEAVQAFERGIEIGDDTPTLPAQLEILDGQREAMLTITEGRYHQVKRMFHAVGCEVVELVRMSIGDLTIAAMEPGEYRKLTAEEVQALMR